MLDTGYLLDAIEPTPEEEQAARAALLRRQRAPGAPPPPGQLARPAGPPAGDELSLLLDEDTGTVQERAAAIAAALRGHRAPMQPSGQSSEVEAMRAAGNLGILTGDSVLTRFGEAQLQQAQTRAPQVLRDEELRQSAFRLGLQALAEARQGRQGDERLGYTKEQIALARGLGYGNLNQRAVEMTTDWEKFVLGIEDRKRRQLDEDVKAFGSEVADSGAPEFFERVDVAKGIFGKYPSDLPGFGKGGFIPDQALDKLLPADQAEDARRLRQSVGQALASYQKFITGAGASDSERENLTRITGLLQSGNEQSVRLGVRQLEAAMEAAVRARAGAFTPEAVRVYGNRVPRIGAVVGGDGGTTPPGPARTTPHAGLPLGPDGQPTLDAPPPPGKATGTPGSEPWRVKDGAPAPAGKVKIQEVSSGKKFLVPAKRWADLQRDKPGAYKEVR